jgi:DNA-binding CsgD family transcriptional regulator
MRWTLALGEANHIYLRRRFHYLMEGFDDMFTRSPWRCGLVLAFLFGWIFSFPILGPFLVATDMVDAPIKAGVFVASLAIGLFTLQMLPTKYATNHLIVRTAGGLIAILTLLYVFIPGDLYFGCLLLAMLGLLTAYLGLAWVPWFAVQDQPLLVLTVAMIGSGVISAMAKFAPLVLTKSRLSALAIIVAACTFLYPETFSDIRPVKAHSTSTPTRRSISMVLALSAFLIAVYFSASTWHLKTSPDLHPFWPSVDSLIYAGSIPLFAYIAERSDPVDLSVYSLSALGLALLAAATQSSAELAISTYHTMLYFGLAAADLFFWNGLLMLGAYYGHRKVFGVALGTVVIVEALATLMARGEPLYSRSDSFFTVFNAIIFFAMTPLVFRSSQAFRQEYANKMTPKLEDSTPDHVEEEPGSSKAPYNLTPSETRIFSFLLEGCTDADIAAKLFISRNTVKFHVRNILRKAEVSNRKELLSYVLAMQEGSRSVKPVTTEGKTISS